MKFFYGEVIYSFHIRIFNEVITIPYVVEIAKWLRA